MRDSSKGISVRLARLGLITALAVGITMTAILLYIEYKRELTYIDLQIDKIMLMTKPPLISATYTNNIGLVNEISSGLLYNDIIRKVEVRNPENIPLSVLSKPDVTTHTSWISRIIYPDVKIKDFALSTTANFDFGRVAIYIDMDQALQPFYSEAKLLIIFGMIRSSILVLILFIAYYFLLTKPFVLLNRQIQAINPKSPGDSRIFISSASRTSEISHLVDSVNNLLDTVDLALAKRSAVEGVLRKSEEHIRQIIDSLPVWVGARNKDGFYIFANKALADFFNTTPEAMRGAHVSEFSQFYTHSDTTAAARDKTVIESVTCSQVCQEQWTDIQGRERNMHTYIMPLEFYDDTVALIVSSDITELKRTQAQIEHMAYHDALTGLPNRSFLIERLDKELISAAKHDYYGAVLFIDLDQFKHINDSLGHLAGDEVLKHVAKKLQAVTKSRDITVRLGGDEFIVVLTDLGCELTHAVSKAEEVGTRLRNFIAQPHFFNDLQLHVTCSVGIVMYPEDNADAYELMQYADAAMYQVKEQGRNAIQFFNKYLADKARDLLKLEGDLHSAFSSETFKLSYQPRVNSITNQIIGAEALLRWEHPERGMIPPSEFIPILETSGLIVEVGKWIVEAVVLQVGEWVKKGIWQSDMRVSINISPRQFRSTSFVNEVLALLDKEEFDGRLLEMEITETIFIHSLEDTIDTMKTLAQKGINFALDDFGTGYSSISYLKQLPVQTLKIDQSFIRDITFDRNDRVLVETISAMGHMLDLDVVAEGVETPEQLALIRQYQCHYYQGYLCSKPLNPFDFVALLESQPQTMLKMFESS